MMIRKKKVPIYNRYTKREIMAGYCFILPAAVFLALIVIYPLIYNLSMSFHEVTLETFRGGQPFIGLENYKEVLAMPMVRKAIWNTIYFTVMSIIFQFVIGFALALLFSKAFRLSKISRGLLMVCWLVPVIVFASVWKWIFAGDGSGILNYFLTQLHIVKAPVSWLTTERGAMTALIITNIWRGVPSNMLLLATGLTTLPEELFEAAAIDGANRIQRFRHITLPLLKPTILSVVTLGFIYTFKAFDLIYIMTNGGPLDSTQILATASYKLTFSNFEFGQGAAVANIMLILLLVVAIFNLKLMEKDEVM